MPKVTFQNNEFDSFHEATCSALFNRYGWTWEKPRHSLGGWRPDFLLKGDVSVYVECKGSLKWEDVSGFNELTRLEDAVSGSPAEVLLIPDSPRRVENTRGYATSILGFLFDGTYWSYAELGRWSGRVVFCHSANSWKDRISGEAVGMSSGDGQPPDIVADWRSAESIVMRGKRLSFFKGFIDADVKTWEPSSRELEPSKE